CLSNFFSLLEMADMRTQDRLLDIAVISYTKEKPTDFMVLLLHDHKCQNAKGTNHTLYAILAVRYRRVSPGCGM
ncbi:hypothetical protein V4Y02_24225, partial [Escherichia coli]